MPGQSTPVPSVDTSAELLNPVGTYDLTMSSEIMVAEGTMQIRGRPDRYSGTVAVGSFGGRIVKVEPGAGQLVVEVDTETGRLVFRLAGDGSRLSGNWVLGQLRGTIVAERSRDRVGQLRGWRVRRPGIHRQVGPAAPFRPRPVVDRDVRIS